MFHLTKINAIKILSHKLTIIINLNIVAILCRLVVKKLYALFVRIIMCWMLRIMTVFSLVKLFSIAKQLQYSNNSSSVKNVRRGIINLKIIMYVILILRIILVNMFKIVVYMGQMMMGRAYIVKIVKKNFLCFRIRVKKLRRKIKLSFVRYINRMLIIVVYSNAIYVIVGIRQQSYLLRNVRNALSI